MRTRRPAEALLRRGDVEVAADARSGRVLPSGSTCASPDLAPRACAGRLGIHRSLLVELVRARVEPQRQLRSTSGGVSPDRAGRRDGTSRAESDRRREAAARRAAVRRPGAFHPERDPVHAGHSPGDAEVRAPPASADGLGRDDPVQGRAARVHRAPRRMALVHRRADEPQPPPVHLRPELPGLYGAMGSRPRSGLRAELPARRLDRPEAIVRFAMRILVPPHATAASSAFDWILAPHTWNAPQATGYAQLR